MYDIFRTNFVSFYFLTTLLGVIAYPLLTVNQGDLEGATLTTSSGFSYYAFSGIPYAKPPVGHLKFKEPLPPDSWEGVRNATIEGNVCAAVDALGNGITGQEDCLYLNVYVPGNITDSSSLPVMFWIHGGGFSSGSGSRQMYGPDYFVEQNVIVVTINYRLGALGFLCLHNAEVPGNAGLKDQVKALQWVNDNIQHFGGNKENITIFGESAGGISVHFLVLSPLTAGLFANSIAQSGTSTVEGYIQTKPVETAFNFGKLLGIVTDNKEELLEFLNEIPLEILLAADISEVSEGKKLKAFAPVVEQQFPESHAFITDDPIELFESGRFNRVSSISGFNSNEGVLNILQLSGVDLDTATLDDLIPNFNIFIPSHLDPDPATSDIIINRVKKFYFDNDDSVIENYLKLVSDFYFVKNIDFSVKQLTKYVPNTYYYLFSYSGGMNIMKFLTTYPYKGAAHTDELGYLFRIPNMPFVPSETDVAVAKLMIELWTNFAKTGNPTPQLSANVNTIWKPLTSNETFCLDINDKTALIEKPFEERIQFWEEVNNL